MVFTIAKSKQNKDIKKGSRHAAKEKYLELYDGFESKLPFPHVYPAEERNDIFIIDFPKAGIGLKMLGAEKFIAESEYTTFGYATPRVGHAAEAISALCETYNKRCVFFAPASKEVSAHQAVVLGYKNTELRFVRIPAMPTLNAWIKQWAEKFGNLHLPFGLSGVPEVTASLVAFCDWFTFFHYEPPEFYCAVSTGTMIRALQIGWPNSTPHGVAVARNIKEGEIGDAKVISYHKDFYAASDYMPSFDTTATYDAKAYKHFIDTAKPGSVFINVGADNQIEKRLSLVKNWRKIKSARDWTERECFDYDYNN